MKRVFVIISILIAGCIKLYSQYQPVSNQYLLNPVIINPSFAGGSGALSVTSFYGKQWIGVDGSPSTFTFSLDAPLFHDKIGLGLDVKTDKLGVTRNNQFTSSYAFRINMDNSSLAFGLAAGVILTNTSFSDLIVLDPGDEIYLADSRVFVVPNFSFGLNYSYRQFYMGLSVPRLINYRFDYVKNKYVPENDMLKYSYLFYTGHDINLSANFRIAPSVLLHYTTAPVNEKLQYDLNLRFGFVNSFWIGGSYRNNRSASVLLIISPGDQLSIAYSYNYDLNELGRYSNGSHEIMLRYRLKYRVEAANPLVF